MTNNTKLWDGVCETDPSATKPFLRPGGFKGTGVDPMYLIQKATSVWGPMGDAWGAKEVQTILEGGAVYMKVQVYYPSSSNKEELAIVEQWGGTNMYRKPKDGVQEADDEAFKKSFTDGLSKCLSYLGFSADVHMGRFDDSKYIDALSAKYDEEKSKARVIKQLPAMEEALAAVETKDGLAIWECMSEKFMDVCKLRVPDYHEELLHRYLEKKEELE